MRRVIRIAGGAGLIALMMSGATIGRSSAAEEAANLIAYRQSVFRAMEDHMAAIDSIVEGKVELWHHVGDHAAAISGMSRGMLELFPHWSGPSKGPTMALPAIWKRWQDYEKAAIQFNQEAAALVTSVGMIDRRLVKQQFDRVNASCNGCHDAFLKQEP